MSTEAQNPAPVEEPRLEASRSKALLWVIAGLVIVVGIGLAAVSNIGGSVLYYKTPTEVLQEKPTEAVRLSGKLVVDSQQTNSDGSVTFDVTDGTSTVRVRYTGGATTALQSAARPGASMVAEGTLDANGIFQSTNLLAKCPSKFQAASSEQASSAAGS